MASTSVDVKELPASYVFVADVPGMKNTDVKVQIENDSILKISGDRKRDNDNSHYDTKFVRVERSAGKFMRKFNLPANAALDSVSAACQDGLLTVVVPKIPPPEPYKPKTYDINVGAMHLTSPP
ncbi:17.3 kDa class II heat shock protein [Selaginella moellendorffii]|nr:17.3 kDa class II heat shock protein [Selaginella moellendorffii]|eukprot:XP_002961434.2 17.3 kDa class II heat shock protein [Selaginella moellendorffii]